MPQATNRISNVSDLRRELPVCFVDIGRIVDHHCLTFFRRELSVCFVDIGRIVYFVDIGRIVYFVDIGRIVYFVDIGRIAYYHCLNFLSVAILKHVSILLTISLINTIQLYTFLGDLPIRFSEYN